MKSHTVAHSCLWLALAFFAPRVLAAACESALIGDFATNPKGAAALRIEKIGGQTISRMKNEAGTWAAEFDPVQVIDQERLVKMFDEAPWAAKSCGFGVAGIGMLLKVPIGTRYQTSSLTERSLDTKHAKSGFVAYAAQGFAVSVVDLYPVARQGESPPMPVPLSKFPGKEVPATPICAGNRMPDMTQAAFNALPSAYLAWFRKQDRDAQLQFVCGQYLGGLMMNHPKNGVYHAEFEDLGPKLEQLQVLLNAGQVPRNREGISNWQMGAYFLLSREHDDQSTHRITEHSLNPKLNDLFTQKILPRLDPASDDGDLTLFKEALYLPDDLGLRLMKKLNARGALRQKTNHVLFMYANQATELLGAAGISQAKFDYLLKEAGPAALNDRRLMLDKIGLEDLAGIRRLLAAGANPINDGLLAIAKESKLAIYQLMLKAAFKASKPTGGSIETSKLPAKEAHSILKSVLRECEHIDWAEVDYWSRHGAALSDFNRFNSIVEFALRCPDGFKSLVKKGLPLVVTDATKNKSNGTLIEYLRTESRYYPHRIDVVAAMLAKDENFKNCAQCVHDGFDLSLQLDEPEITKAMLNLGADPTLADTKGYTGFLIAIIHDEPELVEHMLQKKRINIDALDKEGVSPLAWARCTNASKSVEWLKRHGAKDVGYKTCVKTLAQQKKDADS